VRLKGEAGRKKVRGKGPASRGAEMILRTTVFWSGVRKADVHLAGKGQKERVEIKGGQKKRGKRLPQSTPFFRNLASG